MKLSRFAPLSGVALATALVGCGGNSNTVIPPEVRVINGLDGVPYATANVGTTSISSSLSYATISGYPAKPYTQVVAGPQTVTFASASAPAATLAGAIVSVLSGQSVQCIAYGNAGSTGVVSLYNYLPPPVQAAFRVVNASAQLGKVDVFVTVPGAALTGVQTLTPGQVAPAQTGTAGVYTQLATAGLTELRVYPAGNDAGTPLIDIQYNFELGTGWTLVLLDSPTAGGSPVVLQVEDTLLTDQTHD